MINEQVIKIEKMLASDASIKDILDLNEFSGTSLDRCNIPVSYLVPEVNGNPLDCETWDTHTSNNHKWELWEGNPFGSNNRQRDRVLMGLLYSCGLQYFFNLLPEKSKEDLIKIVALYKIKNDNK